MRALLAICASMILLGAIVSAQTPAPVVVTPLTDTDIQLLRSDVQADKNQIIADTMQFTDAESTAFWPVYRDYTRDQQAIGDDRVQLIKDYAKNYDSMDDAKAKDMVQRMINIEDKTLNLREDYWPKFMKALGAKRAAKFYQVDSRLSLIINVQLTSAIPLLP
jgi:Spy/CpxP family protein refolding chaperone